MFIFTTESCIITLQGGDVMFSERLKTARKNKGFSQKALAAELYISQQAYAKYETGTATPNPEMLKKIADKLDTTVGYLVGEDFTLPKYDNIFPIEKKKFPLLGEIACGKPIFADEDKESYIEAGTDIKADFCLKAKGDSMINARILDGDIVFIRQQPIVDNGEIAAVIIEDEATLKRVYYYPEQGKLILNPENPKYEPLVYVKEELDQIRILGKAVAFQSVVK